MARPTHLDLNGKPLCRDKVKWPYPILTPDYALGEEERETIPPNICLRCRDQVGYAILRGDVAMVRKYRSDMRDWDGTL